MTFKAQPDDFYEDDEPVEAIRTAVSRGEKGVTKRPRDLNQLPASIVEDATTITEAVAAPHGVSAVFRSIRLEESGIRSDSTQPSVFTP